MTNAPEKIYSYRWWDDEGVWCNERCNKTDVKYIRADLVDEMREVCKAAREFVNNPDLVILNILKTALAALEVNNE